MSGLFRTSNELNTLVVARKIEWLTLDVDPNSGTYALNIPDDDGDGEILNNTPRVRVIVDLRNELHTRRARVTVTTVDLTAQYTSIVGGNSVIYDAGVALPADLPALITGWRDAINASAPTNTIVVATAVESVVGGGIDTLELKGLAKADYTFDATAGGTAVIASSVDASSANLNIYTQALGSNAPAGWRKPLDASFVISKEGIDAGFNSAGHKRISIELENIAGLVGDGSSVTQTVARASIGRALIEGV